MAEVHYVEGGVVDGYCPKCETKTEHTIVKATKRSIRQVRCEQCRFVHKYQKTAGKTKTKGKAKTKRSRKKKAKEVDDAAQIQAEWEAACLEHADEEPRDYDMKKEWEEGAVLLHPRFGKGVVTRRLGDKKVEVIFQNARKRLVQNLG
jgi:ribosomal protein L44E